MIGDDDDEAGLSPAAQPLLDAESAPLTSAGLDGAPAPEISSSADAPGAVTASRQRGSGSGAEDYSLEEFTPVSYNYSFFHLIFALASMYIAMLMTGWGAVEQEKDRLDVGWTSVWVKTAAEWATALLYIWTLVAPSLFPDREFV